MTRHEERPSAKLGRPRSERRWIAISAAAAAVVSSAWHPPSARADEGGVSFWLPGLFGSFAASPASPGWSGVVTYYHSSLSTSAGKTFEDGTNFVVGIKGQADLAFYGVTYTFAQPVAGGQFAFSVFNAGGRNLVDVSETLTGPMGNELTGSRSQSLTSFGDLIPLATEKWNSGVNNFMIYATGDIPVGDYDASRLVNLGIGHGAFDGGGGYTYLNSTTGVEFSATAGLTYNFENFSTQYQNGVDSHLDWGLSRILTKQVNIGLVGYFYQQLTDDSGPDAKLGEFRSRVAGIGPQANFFFPVGNKVNGAVSVKAYKEFAAENRPEGWNVWLTLSFSEASPSAAAEPVSAKY